MKEKLFLESLNKDASKRDLNYGTLAGFLPKHLPQKRDIPTNAKRRRLSARAYNCFFNYDKSLKIRYSESTTAAHRFIVDKRP